MQETRCTDVSARGAGCCVTCGGIHLLCAQESTLMPMQQRSNNDAEDVSGEKRDQVFDAVRGEDAGRQKRL